MFKVKKCITRLTNMSDNVVTVELFSEISETNRIRKYFNNKLPPEIIWICETMI